MSIVALPVDPPDPSAGRGLLDYCDEWRRLSTAQRISRVGSWHLDLGSGRLEVSPVLLELYGLPASTDVNDSSPLDRLVHDDDRDLMTSAIDALRQYGHPIDFRFRAHRANDGRLRWFHARAIADEKTGGLDGTIADVTDTVAAELDARQAHADLLRAGAEQQAVIAATPDAIHVFDPASGSFSRASDSDRPFTGFTAESVQVLSGVDVHTFVPSADLRKLEAMLAGAVDLPDGEVAHLRHRVRHRDGSYRWLSRRMTPLTRDDDGRVSSVLVVSRDVTESVVGRHRLEHAAQHDDLTGLANRRLFRDRLGAAVERDDLGVAVLVCDLDGFKRINDSHGHRAGDQVLIQAANRLVGVTRACDTVARLGGDEFAVIVELPPDQDAHEFVQGVAERIIETVAEPFVGGDYEYALTASVGIAIAGFGDDAEAVLNDADAAMYFIKHRGANGHTFYDPTHRPDVSTADRLERLIRSALADDLVEIHYQPVVDPRTHRVQGIEALLRIWDDQAGAYADTGKVVQVAEATGQIVALDERVLHLACAQVVTWRRLPGLEHLMLKVNRSAKEVARPGFRQRVSDALLTSGLDPHALTIELTETVLLDATAQTLDDLRALHTLGLGLAIDDFGTGFASLRYLAELPVTCIKIDRSFVAELPDDLTAATLVSVTIGLARQLGIDCIVEGVETTTQLDALSLDGRVLIQGYLFSRPRPADTPPPTHLEPARA